MMKKTVIASVLLLTFISLFLLNGCAKKKQAKLLQLRVTQYNDLIRWREYDKAVDFVQDKEKFMAEMERKGNDYQVIDYSVSEIKHELGDTKAFAIIEREYHVLPSVTIKNEKITQVWEFTNKNWYLVSPY